MLPPETIATLARQLYDARKSRTQLRHFSKAESIPRSTASSGMSEFFQISIRAQSTGDSRNNPDPRAR